MFDLIATYTLLLIPAFWLLDFVVKRRDYKAPRYWKVRACIISVLMVLFTGEVAGGWAKLVGSTTLFDLSSVNPWLGAAIGVLTYEFIHYWYHRAVHSSDFLWRYVGHQMHHSAESLDAFGANFLHPIDAALFTTWVVFVFGPLLGLSEEAAVLGGFFLLFNSMFQHANIKTPRVLGYLIQRPESHDIHHQRGVHASNYSDLPLWDIVFGTFKNPEEMPQESCGFYEGASSRLGAMLIGQDASTPAQPDEEAPVSVPASIL